MHLIVMGVAGCGKSSIARAVAAKLSWRYVEGDDYHTSNSVQKMAAGQALTDEDRRLWLERLVAILGESDANLVLTCSALKEKYRDELRTGGRVRFAYIRLAREVAHARVASRPGHMFPASLVDSQFAALEEPSDEPDVLTVNGQRSVADLATDIASWLRAAI